MYRTITASSQFKIYAAVALAALLMTVLAVTLTASQAQATTTTSTTIVTDGDDNPIPQQQGQAATPTPAPHKTPEACPAKGETASVVDSGYYALFDVWWNDEEGELTNNVCPPRVEFIPENEDEGTTASVNRSPSSINITADPPTIIHIPNSAKVTLSESNYPRNKYGEVWHADDAENPNGDGDRKVWALPACPDSPTTGGLCLSYSAALLNSADWNGNIEYIVTHVHQVDIDKQDRRYVLVYDGPESRPALRWYSANENTDTVSVAPGEYDRPMWFFPSRGAYEFQVYIRGNPNTAGENPISKDASVTSDLREYIVHVGAEANLGVTTAVAPADASDRSLDPGDNVTITVTAGNAGPDEAEKTKVDVVLPDGLTYSSHSTATGAYADGVWSISEFANGASATLTVTARVDAETHGQDLTVNAAISATETVTTNSGNHEVPVPDPTPGNNTASGSVTVASSANVDPMFVVIRSVAENSQGVNLGDPVPVLAGDDDTLTYTLTGVGADNFTASSVAGGVQIAVASGANLDYEAKQSYDLTLGVSDGKDGAGNDDSSIDDTIAVVIEILDVTDSTLSVSADRRFAHFGTSATWTASISPPVPAVVTNVVYHWRVHRNYGPSPGTPPSGWQTLSETGPTVTWTMEGPDSADVVMAVSASYTDGHGNSHSLAEVEGGLVGFDNLP